MSTPVGLSFEIVVLRIKKDWIVPSSGENLLPNLELFLASKYRGSQPPISEFNETN
ncbi:12113_t:CDS:2 [Funneliformis mosseae]|uniref:12113_t:CDS:1 n=1 Tax=Funneliformis mosseae TaxID=27381 RepID=A0A9N9GQC9_FUNMO|nr:12113_t:CDS:2 [Funneliformis mosseae]